MARFRVGGKIQNFGTYDTAKQAAEAHDRASIQTGRPTSKLNFLDQVPKNYKPKKRKHRSTNTLGYRGVYQVGKKFRAAIFTHGKLHCIGTFETALDAAKEYDLAAIQAKRPTSDLNLSMEVESSSI